MLDDNDIHKIIEQMKVEKTGSIKVSRLWSVFEKQRRPHEPYVWIHKCECFSVEFWIVAEKAFQEDEISRSGNIRLLTVNELISSADSRNEEFPDVEVKASSFDYGFFVFF